MIWLDLILLSSPLEYYMLVYEIWGLGEYQLPEVLLKAVQDPFASRIQSVVAFLGWGHLHFLLLFLPHCQGTLCPAALGNSGLPFLLIGSIPPSSCPFTPQCFYRFFCHPWILVFIWTGVSLTSFPRCGVNKLLVNTRSILQYLLCLGCGHRIASL